MALTLFSLQVAAARVLQQRANQAVAQDSTAQDAVQAADSSAANTLSDFVEAPGQALANLGEIFSIEAIVVSGLKVVLIILISWSAIKLVDRTLHLWNRKFEGLPLIAPRRQRALTTSTLLSSTIRYVVGAIALIMVLDVLHIDVAAIIATAGIAGIAIGFGAQSLVKDMIGGILLLFDDTIHVGDLIRVGTDEGLVEDIGVRTIKVRRFNGELLVVPSGDLRTFGNRSVGFVRAIVPVGLSYDQDVERIMAVMQDVADAYAEEHKEIMLDEDPLVQAITNFSESSVDARIVIKMLPGEQFEGERELRRRLKQAFDEAGITIPFPQRTLHISSAEGAPDPFGVEKKPALPQTPDEESEHRSKRESENDEDTPGY